MLFLKVAAVITLIVSLLISPSAKHPKGRMDLLNRSNAPSGQSLTARVPVTRCKATLEGGVPCIEKAAHNGYCTQHFKE